MNNIKIKDIIKTTNFILFISFIIWSILLRKIEVKIINEYIFKDRKSTRLNSSHSGESRMPSSA